MMFWLVVAGLMVLALVFLVIPILRQPQEQVDSDRQQQNILIAREKKSQLESQLQQGELNQSEYDAAFQDLQTSLALDLEREEKGAQQKQGQWAVWVLAVLVPLVSATLYMKLGEYRVIDNPQLAMRQAPAAAQDMSIETMLERVKQRLRDNPDDAEGWFILGRTLLSMRQIDEAVVAFQRTYDLVGDQPGVMFTLADALALQNQGAMAGEPEELVRRGLQISADDPTGLWLAGLAAEQRSDYPLAHSYWSKMLPFIAEDAASSAEVRRLLAVLEKRDSSIEPIVAGASPSSSATITVRVDLDASLRSQAAPGDAVFIYAKAMQGPPMPLAVKRLSVSDLPVSVSLSDDDAMMAAMKLSSFDRIIIGARVSKSGNPVAQAGDLYIEMDSIDSKNPPDDLRLMINLVR